MVLTEMINLTAEIAEQLLVAKDNDSEGLAPKTKLDIIKLAELAATLPDIEDVAEPVPDSEPVDEPLPEPEPDDEVAPALESEPEPVVEPVVEAPAPQPATGLVAAELRRMFSLNDLFLFRRELFQGSQVLFDQALEDVGTCSSADEARAVLVERYALDSKRPEAKEFMAVISGLFEL